MTALTRLLLSFCEVYRREAQILSGKPLSERTVSLRIFRGEADKIHRIRSGGDVTTATFIEAVKWLEQNWPLGRPKPPAIAWVLGSFSVWQSATDDLEADASKVEAVHRAIRSDRAVRLKELAELGYSTREAAQAVGVSYIAARNAAIRHGFQFRSERKSQQSPISRSVRVAAE